MTLQSGEIEVLEELERKCELYLGIIKDYEKRLKAAEYLISIIKERK